MKGIGGFGLGADHFLVTVEVCDDLFLEGERGERNLDGRQVFQVDAL